MSDYVAKAAMFFAGLILLIPHRIGMSRVNYVIKRYNLPISRAGLLLYKYHNNIELSLTIGTLPGNFIVWRGGGFGGEKWQMSNICYLMITFLSFMLLSSIIMFIIYIAGGDYGHLNSFYFSLIFLTLFDGFANAFAFGINGLYSSMLSAGIPLSGLLVTLLHYIYKFFSDLYHWDDFDYYVLRLQLLCNIIIILIALGLWIIDLIMNHSSGKDAKDVADIKELFGSGSNHHIYDWFPICMLAISLGTVYAFYPSIAPYSIIDYQYASVIELWILIISALLPFSFAILDLWEYGPSGKKPKDVQSITLSGSNATEVKSGNDKVDFSDEKLRDITLTNIMVKHQKQGDNVSNIKHPKDSTTPCTDPTADTTLHAYKSGTNDATIEYTLNPTTDKVKDTTNEQAISTYTSTNGFELPSSSVPKTLNYTLYYNWFYKPTVTISEINHTSGTNKIEFTAGSTSSNGVNPDQISVNIPKETPNNVTWTEAPDSEYNRSYWNLVWFCAIFYILCIQIFMSLLHYPHSLLSSFFNHPRISFISVLFNTLRELMQACGFAGAGKQCKNIVLDKNIDFNGTIFNLTYTATGKKVYWKGTSTLNNGDIKLNNSTQPSGLSGTYDNSGQTQQLTFTEMTANVTSTKLPLPGWTATAYLKGANPNFNGTIAATNKLITLFVMMFCVFTGDGYLQHYRRCCRDNWPTTGYNKYQSFFYWLRYGFKGGIKSITLS